MERRFRLSFLSICERVATERKNIVREAGVFSSVYVHPFDVEMIYNLHLVVLLVSDHAELVFLYEFELVYFCC